MHWIAESVIFSSWKVYITSALLLFFVSLFFVIMPHYLRVCMFDHVRKFHHFFHAPLSATWAKPGFHYVTMY